MLVPGCLRRVAGRISASSGTGIIGIVGAFIGGFIASLLGFAEIEQGFNLKSFIFAVIGSVVLLLIYRMVKGKSAGWGAKVLGPYNEKL